MPEKQQPQLTVAVTGPTGEIGRSFLRALERSKQVKEIRGMARRPFDPSELGLKKTVYRQGDILDREAVDDFVRGADVVVHLAFIIFGSHDETHSINLDGSRNVFEAVVAADSVKRLVYTSSVAAYGFHDDNPVPLTEDIAPRGTDAHYYSAQKAELEGTLGQIISGADVEAYVFRPCIVAGEDALMLIDQLPYVRLGDKLPDPVRRVMEAMPILRPVIPDTGIPFQLVHSEDVASALVAATVGRGTPGIYNLAGDGEITTSDLADALGWYAVPLPEIAVDATAEVVARLPFLPEEASWVNAMRVPVVMDTTKAKRELKWKPKHTTREVLLETVLSARERELL